jgi:anthranilate synthase component I
MPKLPHALFGKKVSFDEFRTRAATGGLVPVSREVLLDIDTPISAFAKLRRGPFAFLLESAPAGSESWSRYTFLGTEPVAAWRLRGNTVEDWTASEGWHSARTSDDPLAELETKLRELNPVPAPELGVFWSGAVGYIGYEAVSHMENIIPAHTSDLPDAMFMITRTVVVLDHLRSQAMVIVGVPVDAGSPDDELRRLYLEAESEIDTVLARLHSPGTTPALRLDSKAVPAAAKTSMSKTQFMDAVDSIKEYIRAGDCFQVLLSRQFVLPHDFSGTDLYRALRAINPSPYMFHLLMDGMELIGSSPELLVRMADGDVIVRPIAGTRPRGSTPGEDQLMEEELIHDTKEIAEHVMLLDLGRNDVGRVAEFGSVEATQKMVVERYSHVLHMVSQVEGKRAAGKGAADVLRATFPAGTLTGAPKVRAMEIINELETVARGPYGGAVGYIAAGAERLDLAITIRTCAIANGTATVQAGAGIVADSVPEREWEETENKARALLTAIGRVRAAQVSR